MIEITIETFAIMDNKLRILFILLFVLIVNNVNCYSINKDLRKYCKVWFMTHKNNTEFSFGSEKKDVAGLHPSSGVFLLTSTSFYHSHPPDTLDSGVKLRLRLDIASINLFDWLLTMPIRQFFWVTAGFTKVTLIQDHWIFYINSILHINIIYEGWRPPETVKCQYSRKYNSAL